MDLEEEEAAEVEALVADEVEAVEEVPDGEVVKFPHFY